MKNILDWIEENKQQFEDPEPRITVAQLDNVNTPDLEQSEFLEPKRIDIFGNVIPAETLEDWDVTFRRPNADGGRIGFKKDGFVGPKTLEYKKGRGIDKASVRDLNPFFKGTIKGSKFMK